MLQITKLRANRDNKEILKGINLQIEPGEIHALMGPNGSGKSTFASALMGHPNVEVTSGSVKLDKKNLLKMTVDERARAGLFLAFQHPREIQGVPYLEFLRLSYNKKTSPFKFKKIVEEKMKELQMDFSFLERNLNEGFSGGEKKKSEILQMAILEPKYAILDETDSGLDVSALKIVAEDARKLSKKHNIGMLVITHYKRILDYMNPDKVHVMLDGKIVKSGSRQLADELDEVGYEKIIAT